MEFQTHYELGDIGEVPLVVEFDYQPAEPAIYYPNEEAYPGCAASSEITSVMLIGDNGKTEILELCNEYMLDSLSDSAVEYVHDSEEEER